MSEKIGRAQSDEVVAARMPPDEIAALDLLVTRTGFSRSLIVRALVNLATGYAVRSGGIIPPLEDAIREWRYAKLTNAVEERRIALAAKEEARRAKKEAALESQLAAIRALRQR